MWLKQRIISGCRYPMPIWVNFGWGWLLARHWPSEGPTLQDLSHLFVQPSVVVVVGAGSVGQDECTDIIVTSSPLAKPQEGDVLPNSIHHRLKLAWNRSEYDGPMVPWTRVRTKLDMRIQFQMSWWWIMIEMVRSQNIFPLLNVVIVWAVRNTG
jgi:hypothetical protein